MNGVRAMVRMGVAGGVGGWVGGAIGVRREVDTDAIESQLRPKTLQSQLL